METITKSPEATYQLGEKIGASLAISHQPSVIALVGDLGSGKTTFVQGLAKGLGIEKKIISPTFILMRSYKIQNTKYQILNLYHVDLYRLEGNVAEEAKNLGLTDIWGKKDNIVVIEWAEKIKEIIPKKAKWIKFENIGEDERKITI